MHVNRYPSKYLPGVDALLSSLADDDLQWRERLSRWGPTPPFLGSDLRPLRVALQLTPPFKDSTLDMFKDTREEKALHPMACQDRVRLEEALAMELWRYEQLCKTIEHSLETLHAAIVHHMVQVFPLVAQLASRYPKLQSRRIQKACQTFANHIDWLATQPPKNDHTELPSKDELQRIFVDRMGQIFKMYGPSRWRHEPTYSAIAAILVCFGVEKEQQRLKTISSKYRKWHTSPEHRPTPRAEQVYRQWDQLLPFPPRHVPQQ
jgi:hypothetical protein